MHKDCTNLLANDLGLAGLQHPGTDDDGVFSRQWAKAAACAGGWIKFDRRTLLP
jgi:dissimilatory sulfite reductase (desulfoviridin) alpha/beta subunit